MADRPDLATHRPKWRWLAIIIACAVAVAIGTAIYLWKTFSSPASGTFSAKSMPGSAQQTQSVSYKQLKGQTFTLDYPSTYAPEAMSSKSHYTGLDNFILATNNFAGNDHLAIVVANALGPLESNSSFHYRLLHPELYAQTKRPLGVDTIFVFMKTDGGYEQTVFIPHKDLIATIALTSSRVEVAEHAQTIDHLLATFRWISP